MHRILYAVVTFPEIDAYIVYLKDKTPENRANWLKANKEAQIRSRQELRDVANRLVEKTLAERK